MATVASVTPVPFALALLLGLALFAALTWYLVQDSRRPVDWTSIDARASADAMPHLSHTRLAAVCVVFAIWSLWATARPVSGWR
ncbi:MAG TPA: hypothetical protein VK549_12985 [Acidimicrobiia bacterium]|nr:hypothetical protein [Acidimicrobiia bacterium]